jgi:hypothetical protein
MSDLLLGPAGADKIAIIGSAPSSIRLAPYRDMSWAIWGCSPGAYGYCERKDAWFELHRWEPQEPGFPNDPAAQPWYSPEYVRFMEIFDGPVFMLEPVPSVKNCVLFPFERLLKKYGPYHFQSTMSWMLAYAIEQHPKVIGMWGIDCAANEEYSAQRPGVQHFLGLAASLGIQIVLPPESDLLQPTTMYGICETHPRFVKLLARKRELQGRVTALEQNVSRMQGEALFLKGAIDNLDYIFKHWILDIEPSIEMAVSHSAKLAMIPDPITTMRAGGWPDGVTPNRPDQPAIKMPDHNGANDAVVQPGAQEAIKGDLALVSGDPLILP